MSKIDMELPALRGQGGQLADRQSPRAKPPSAVLAHHLGAFIVSRRLPREAMGRFLDRLRDVPHHRCDWRAHRLQEAADAAAELPALAELEHALACITAAGEGRASRAEIARIAAAMVDAIPTFDAEKSAGYLDALLFALELEASVDPFSPEILAAAAYETMCRSRFAPEPAVLIDAIRAQQKTLRSRTWTLARVVENLPKLQAAIAKEASAA